MDQATSHPLLRFLRRATAAGAAPLVPDAELLQRFLQAEDRSAFELLLWRHGPMVLRVCRAVARDAHDAEDAFQATFLTLARKAGSIGRGEALGAWLYRVAYRIALKAHREGRRRAAHERQGLDLSALPADGSASDPLAQAEVEHLLHAEVERLPAKYQAPVVLCYLEGRTNEEAAAQLGWTKGTVSGRLARARELLRRRLERCGLPCAALALTALTREAAALPASLVYPTLHAAALASSGGSLAGAVAPAVLSLTQGALPVMASIKLKLALALLLGLGVGVVAAYPVVRPDEQGAADKGAAPPVAPQVVRVSAAPAAASPLVRPKDQGTQDKAPPPAKPKVFRISSQVDGVLLAVGTEVTDAEAKGSKMFEVRVGNGVRRYRPLAVGDLVEQGQVLALVDPTKAINEVIFKKAKVIAASANHQAAVATAKEAQARLDRIEKLKAQGVISQDEYSAAVLTRDKYYQEEIAKREEVKLAEVEVLQAQVDLEKYTIRSPVRGHVQAILRQRGEAVRSLETVFEIRQGTEEKAPPPARPKGILVPSAKDGVLLAVGTEVTGAEAKGPKVFEVRVGTEVRRFRPLTVGDLVEKGQVLAQLDDQRPRLEVQSRQARVMVARANHQAAIATAKEAKARLERIGQLKDARAVSEEEYRAAVLKRDKSHQEEIARREEVRLAEIEVLQAQLDLEQYTIRSPVRGHVRAILRQRGEAVRSLEGVFEIRIAEKQ